MIRLELTLAEFGELTVAVRERILVLERRKEIIGRAEWLNAPTWDIDRAIEVERTLLAQLLERGAKC